MRYLYTPEHNPMHRRPQATDHQPGAIIDKLWHEILRERRQKKDYERLHAPHAHTH